MLLQTLEIFHTVAEGPRRPCCILTLLRITKYSQSFWAHINLSQFKISCLKVKHVSKHDTLPNSILRVLNWREKNCVGKRGLSNEQCSSASLLLYISTMSQSRGKKTFVCFLRPPSCKDEKLHWLQLLSVSPLWGLGLFTPPPAPPTPPFPPILSPCCTAPPTSLLQFHPFFHLPVDVGHH